MISQSPAPPVVVDVEVSSLAEPELVSTELLFPVPLVDALVAEGPVAPVDALVAEGSVALVEVGVAVLVEVGASSSLGSSPEHPVLMTISPRMVVRAT